MAKMDEVSTQVLSRLAGWKGLDYRYELPHGKEVFIGRPITSLVLESFIIQAPSDGDLEIIQEDPTGMDRTRLLHATLGKGGQSILDGRRTILKPYFKLYARANLYSGDTASLLILHREIQEVKVG